MFGCAAEKVVDGVTLFLVVFVVGVVIANDEVELFGWDFEIESEKFAGNVLEFAEVGDVAELAEGFFEVLNEIEVVFCFNVVFDVEKA